MKRINWIPMNESHENNQLLAFLQVYRSPPELLVIVNTSSWVSACTFYSSDKHSRPLRRNCQSISRASEDREFRNDTKSEDASVNEWKCQWDTSFVWSITGARGNVAEICTEARRSECKLLASRGSSSAAINLRRRSDDGRHGGARRWSDSKREAER